MRVDVKESPHNTNEAMQLIVAVNVLYPGFLLTTSKKMQKKLRYKQTLHNIAVNDFDAIKICSF